MFVLAALLAIGAVVAVGLGALYRYSNDTGATAPAADAGGGAMRTLYTCGMDPEIIRDEPGDCPKCGMKLVPMDPERTRTVLEARGETVPEAGPAKERKILYWRAPMDPSYIRDEPGKSPMGMDLVPVYEDEVSGGPTVRIDPVTEQNMGLRYAVVQKGPLEKAVRTVGTVDYNEQGLGTVTTKIDGWVEKVHVDTTGVQVHKGEPLFEFYSPQLFSAQEEYLVALRDVEQARKSGGTRLRLAQSRLDSSRARLEFFDISAEQIARLEKEQKVTKTLTITSPLTGVVTHKNVVEGESIKAGEPAYKISDLSTVWVMGKVFESDLPYIQVGQEVQMTLDYLPGRTYRGRVTYVYPYLQSGTREIPVRTEFSNPGYDLKPGMYATLTFQSQLGGEAVLVPAAAVIDTGVRKVAYVVDEPGRFEPRQVETGVRTGNDEWQVLSGLVPGEKIVVSGQFMLDSESRLREATLKMLNPGMADMEGGLPSEAHAGHDADAHAAHETTGARVAAKYVCPMPEHAGILYDEPGDCPLCGMKLVPAHPWSAESSPVAYYTCPDHPDVRSDKPGQCPKDGKTLVPVTEAEAKRLEQAQTDDAVPTLYTCPMESHAHVVSDKPGDCPECGMKLVPTSEVAHGKKSEEIWHEQHSEAAPQAPPSHDHDSQGQTQGGIQ